MHEIKGGAGMQVAVAGIYSTGIYIHTLPTREWNDGFYSTLGRDRDELLVEAAMQSNLRKIFAA